MNRRQLLMLQETYKTDKDIAKYLNVTRQYINYLRKKFAVPLWNTTGVKENRNKLIYTAFMRGATRIELAKKEKLNYITVCRIINKLKKESRNDVVQ
jgi:Mor family transcriptional regulator